MLRLGPGVEVPEGALTYSTSKSGGAGGQHVNKTESKVELRVQVAAICGLSVRAQERLALLAGERLTADGDLILTCDETRSQRTNRDLVLERLSELIRDAKAVPKVRRISKPSWGSVQRRLGAKSARAEIKQARRPVDD